MKKQIIVLGLAVLGAIAVNHNASAQVPTLSNKANSFMVPSKNVEVSHTVLTKGTSRTATFALTNKNNAALKQYEQLTVELPAVSGFAYDLSTLTWGAGASAIKPTVAEPRPAATISNFPVGGSLTFTCALIPSTNAPKQEVVLIQH